MFLIIIKIISTSIIVLTLSMIAERAGPKLAGILSGLPLGSAIALFYIGIEQGPQFAASAGIAMVLGLTASLSFLIAYWISSKYVFKKNDALSILCTIIISVVVFFCCSLGLTLLPREPIIWVLVTLFSSIFCIILFNRIPNTKIVKKVSFSSRTLFTRAMVSAAIVLIITGSAELLGPFHAGLLSGFPITLFPLLLIIHYTYSPDNTWAIIRNFPMGMGSLVIYGVCISMLYPSQGIMVGTITSFLISITYTLLISFMMREK